MWKKSITAHQLFQWAMLTGFFLLAGWLVNTIWYKPFNINTFFERAFFEYSIAHPEDLTAHHAFEKFVFNDYASRLDDISLKNWKATRKQVRWNLEMLRTYKPSKLDPDERLSQQILDFYWEMNIFLKYGDLDTYLRCNYAIDPYNGTHVGFLDFMLNTHEINTLQDAESYLDRLRMGKVQIRQTSDNLQFYAKPPSFILKKIILQIEDYLRVPVEENVFYQDFRHKADRVSNMTEEAQSELHYELKQIIENELQPTYKALLDELINEYDRQLALETADYTPSILKASSKTIGPDGEEYVIPVGEIFYAGMANYNMGRHYNDEVGLERIASDVSEEIMRTREQMALLLDSLGIVPNDDFGMALAQLADRDSMFYEEGDFGQRALLNDVKDLIIKANGYSQKNFGFQAAHIEIREMASYLLPYSSRFFYYPPSLDAYREARLFVNVDSLRTLPKFALPALVHAHAAPGTHFLKTVQHTLKHLPTFRRAIIEFEAYSKGWSFYAQRQMKAQGFYETPHESLGHLHLELAQAVTLMADYYLHYESWTAQEVIDYVAKTGAMSAWEAEAIVAKVAIEPGKAYAYWEGYRVIASLRKQAEERMLGNFNEYAFNQILLKNGPVPMTILENIVGQYIEANALVGASETPKKVETPIFDEPSTIEE